MPAHHEAGRPQDVLTIRLSALLDGLRHLHQMARPVTGRRRPDRDRAILKCAGRDLEVDLPGGSTLIQTESGSLAGEVIILTSAVEAMKRGLISFATKNPPVQLWVQDAHLVLACEVLRARYTLLDPEHLR